VNPGERPQVFASAPWGAARGVTPDELRSIGVAGLFVGSVELSIRPGLDVVDRLGISQVTGGLPVLVESGIRSVVEGFGVSAGRLGRVTTQGIDYRNGLDGARSHLTPEWSIDVQRRLGATLLLAPTPPAKLLVNERLVEVEPSIGVAWLRRAAESVRTGEALVVALAKGPPEYRRTLLDAARELLVAGVASDGEALPDVAPAGWIRIALGAGSPDVVRSAVAGGAQIVESPAPGRLARQGQAWVAGETIEVGLFRDAERPLDPTCDCPACRYALGYLAHLVRANEILGETLLVMHNLRSLVRAAQETTPLNGNSTA
jgi:queuine tRNA-ribosyltransferase